MAILLMGVGKYYSQTKALSQLKKRVRPNVELLDQDAQHFVSAVMYYNYGYHNNIHAYIIHNNNIMIEDIACFVYIYIPVRCGVLIVQCFDELTTIVLLQTIDHAIRFKSFGELHCTCTCM